jgi:hypothetical protein
MSVLSDDPNQRTELSDLLVTQLAYYLESQNYALYGRGLLDYDTHPDELYVISVAQEIQPSGDSTIPRPGDQENMIHESRVSVAVTLFEYQDRAVLVTSGPATGESWRVTSADVLPDEDAT